VFFDLLKTSPKMHFLLDFEKSGSLGKIRE